MTCCGNKRSALAEATRAAADQSVVTTAGPSMRGTRFEYRGGRVLTVVGQGTGQQYRFVGFGARLSVDPRDRATLARVPQLREM